MANLLTTDFHPLGRRRFLPTGQHVIHRAGTSGGATGRFGTVASWIAP